MKPETFWTDARLAELERLWSAGASDESLMAHFDKSRFAIENQRWRLGLCKNGNVAFRPRPWPDMPKDAFR